MGSDVAVKMMENGQQVVIKPALERHHQSRQFGHGRPAPAGKFRFVVGVQIKVFVRAEKAQGIPFLALAAKPAFPR